MTNHSNIELIKNIIEETLKTMGFSMSVSHEESLTKGLVFNISASPDSYLLIGRQGITLHAFQILVQAMVAKKLSGQPVHFTIDVDDYRMKREWYLKETARAAVEQVKKTGRALSLEPMPNYERRIIHAYLQEHAPEVFSESAGFDPHRKIIIRLK